MKRFIVPITAVIVPLFFCLAPTFSKEITIADEKITLVNKNMATIKNKGNERRQGLVLAIGEIHSDKRGLIGILMKVKKKNRTPAIMIEIFNKNENYTGGDLNYSTKNYVGKILPSGSLKPKGARLKYTRISPENAKLYLDALKVIDEIK